ncbi:hypothetical protein LCGC14_0616510 [marine sediment metagenome]|uniref:Uncharacterized protein n=1 Tax=marine sediment metagenome TaxID=412755 RepID=A0A0F9UEK4_9ZZZZ
MPKGKGNLIAGLKRSGEWEENSNLLTQLPEEFDIDVKATKDVLTAIPTVWARPLLFAEALTRKKHPLNHEVTNEWRGFLVIFCFKNEWNFDIQLKSVDIEEESRYGFLRVLHYLKPDAAWNKVYLIYIDGLLLGGTSPKSLFFTAPKYNLPSSISWQEKGLLSDPAKYFHNHGMSKNLGILRQWIEKIKASIDDEITISLFADWLRYINEKTEPSKVKDIPMLPISQDITTPYSIILKYANVKAGGKSDFFIHSSKRSDKNIILIWEDGWKNENKIVYDSIQVKNVKDVPKQKDRNKIRDILQKRAIPCEFVVPKLDFFTEKVIKIPLNEEETFGSHDSGLVPPLKKDILKYFSGKEIEEFFHWETTQEGMLAILSLPLKENTKRRMSNAIISKLYRKGDIIEDIKDKPPVISIWPDFVAPDWKWYYLIAEKSEEANITFEPVTYIEGSDKGEDRELHRIWCFSHWIEGIECKYKGKATGLIMPKLSKPRVLSELKWHVAVDFGTSNTTVCYKQGLDGIPSLLQFKDRTVKLSKTPSDPKEFLSRRFMPFWEGESLTSIFRLLSPTASAMPSPIIDGIILHLDSNPGWPVILVADPMIKPGLKWTTDEKERRLIVTFLQHLLLLIAAEARSNGAKSLTFYSSFPSAFLIGWQDELKNNWEQNVIPILKDGGFSINFESEKNFETESIAVCKYLRKRVDGDKMIIGKQLPACIIDIGGGTTDIGVWKRKGSGIKLLAQASILLAGGVLSDLTITSEKCWKSIINLIPKNFLITYEKEFDEIKKHSLSQSLIPSAINTILKTNGKAMLGKITLESQTKEILKIRSLILFAYGSLFYYVGIILRYIIEILKEDIQGCNIFLAGNGSKLLNSVGTQGAVFKIMKEIIYTSMQFDNLEAKKRINIYSAKHPKEEVARGLLSKERVDLSKSSPIKIIGESGYTYKEADMDWWRDMETETEFLKNTAEVAIPENFPELETYIKIYNQQSEKVQTKKLNNYDPTNIRNYLEDRLASLDKDQIDGELFQPFFIEEVKAVIDTYFK